MAHAFGAAQRSCSAGAPQARLFPHRNNPESPAAGGAAGALTVSPVPSEGPCGQGHHTGRVSGRLSRSTNRRLSLAGPHRSSLRHEAAAAPGCWQRCRARAWAAADTNQRLRPRHSPGSPGASVPGENPVSPLEAERDSVRAPQGIRALVNPCTALKFGVVFPLESSAQGRWEQRCHLGDARSQQPSVTACPRGQPKACRRRQEVSPPPRHDIAEQFGGWSQLRGGSLAESLWCEAPQRVRGR